MNYRIAFVLLILTLASCKKTDHYALEILEADQTGLDFENRLTPSLDLNVFNYMYFYNGGGVGTGDLNNDGLADIVFTANQEDNKIYLNEGNLKFKDITKVSGFVSDEGWSNGIAINDVNQDGMLDIYISQVGKLHNIDAHNLLFICQEINEEGIPIYKEESAAYGLDLVGFGTQAAFFDYDMDGDLDLFQLNHSLHQNGTFGQRKSFQNTYHDLAGDRLLRNDDGVFTDVTKDSGINSSVIGYGLGIATGDLNSDGFPDVYIANDFHENDYLYINNGDGTFTEGLTDQINHTSRFSMGVDIADVNNDLNPDIITLDMLPYDPYILKKSEGEDALDIFRFKLGYGYNHQYAKNSLQINNGNNSFSEVAMYSNLHATDWSWAPLFTDFDNDGLKDVFVSNGIPRRMNDIDYINFMSNDEIQYRVQFDNMEEKDLALIETIPQIKLTNKLFKNESELKFKDLELVIANNKESYSNGLAYADFDNDGDLDYVVNNIDEQAFLYENKLAQNENHYLRLKFEGRKGNLNGIGSKVFVFQEDVVQLYEHYTTKGFQSSSNTELLIGVGKRDVDSIQVIWPDGASETVTALLKDTTVVLRQENARVGAIANNSHKFFRMSNLADSLGINYRHEENAFVEFNREPLIPHATSAEGPALAVGDFNGDGKQDFYVGSAKHGIAAIYLQDDGKFSMSIPENFRTDSIHEEVVAIAEDLNGDGFDDLILGNGGNEYFYKDTPAQSRVLINDHNGGFSRNYIDSLYSTVGDMVLLDINEDGRKELIFGSRAVSWAYGEVPRSYIYELTAEDRYEDATAKFCPEFSNIGFVKGMENVDFDQDGIEEIVIVLEWGGVKLLKKEGNKLIVRELFNDQGWWNFSKSFDYDGDGDIDIFLGNLGLNSRLKASPEEPISLYFNDFDNNGKKEQILTYFLAGKEIPFSNMMEIEKQIPTIKKKYMYAKDFAAATLNDLFTDEKIKGSERLKAVNFQNGLLVNEGGQFTFKALPYFGQLSTYTQAELIDIDEDGLMDVFVLGNFFDNNIQMGRSDAEFGSIFINRGNCEFEVMKAEGDLIKGQVKDIGKIEIDGNTYYLIALNDDQLELLKITK